MVLCLVPGWLVNVHFFFILSHCHCVYRLRESLRLRQHGTVQDGIHDTDNTDTDSDAIWYGLQFGSMLRPRTFQGDVITCVQSLAERDVGGMLSNSLLLLLLNLPWLIASHLSTWPDLTCLCDSSPVQFYSTYHGCWVFLSVDAFWPHDRLLLIELTLWSPLALWQDHQTSLPSIHGQENEEHLLQTRLTTPIQSTPHVFSEALLSFVLSDPVVRSLKQFLCIKSTVNRTVNQKIELNSQRQSPVESSSSRVESTPESDSNQIILNHHQNLNQNSELSEFRILIIDFWFSSSPTTTTTITPAAAAATTTTTTPPPAAAAAAATTSTTTTTTTAAYYWLWLWLYYDH